MKPTETQPRRRDSLLIQLFFVGGCVLVVMGFIYAVTHRWPSLDPLALIALVGMGLLLVVVCERLSMILHELRRISSMLRTVARSPERE